MKNSLLFAVVMAVLVAPSALAQTFVQSTVATTTTTTVTATYSPAPTQNNLLVAVFATQNNTSGLNMSSGWLLAVDNLNTTEDDLLRIAYKVAGAGESSNVVFDGITNQGGRNILAIYEFSGTVASSPLDQTATTARTTGATSLSSGSVTTTTANQVVIPGFAIRAATSSQSFNNSFTLQNATVSGSFTNLNGYRIVSSTGSYSTTASWTTSGTAWAAIASFKGTGGAPPAQPHQLTTLGCCGMAAVIDGTNLAGFEECDPLDADCRQGVSVCLQDPADGSDRCFDLLPGDSPVRFRLWKQTATQRLTSPVGILLATGPGRGMVLQMEQGPPLP